MSSLPELAAVKPSNTGSRADLMRGKRRHPQAKAAPRLRTDLPVGKHCRTTGVKLAAAHAEGIREGLQQAQRSFEKQWPSERAKVAEALRAFCAEDQRILFARGN